MDILMSMYKIWCDKILNGTKPLEFRNNIGKNFRIGKTIYFYESSKNNGSKMVVGQATIKDIVPIPDTTNSTLFFLPYYTKNIIKDNKALDAVQKIIEIDLPHYKDAIKLSYIYLPEHVEIAKETDSFPRLLDMDQNKAIEVMKKQKKSRKLSEDCDNWLSNIGFYNEYGENYYKNYIELENPKRFEIPQPLNNFVDVNGKEITKAPQSWRYANIKE